MLGDTEPVAPRSTASQMQRGSGELQSTPTGFWKLQSDPAGAGHGSIAAGIGAWSLLRSASFTAHMGCSHTLYARSWTMSRCRNTDTIKPREDGWFQCCLQILLWDPSVIQESELPVPWFQSIAVSAEPSENLIPQVPSTSQTIAPDLRESALRDSHTHSNTLRGVQTRGRGRQAPGQQMEECVWQQGSEVGLVSLQTHTENN